MTISVGYKHLLTYNIITSFFSVWFTDFLFGFQLLITSWCYSVLIFIKDLIIFQMNINELHLILSCIIFWTRSHRSTLMNCIQQLTGNMPVQKLSVLSIPKFNNWNITCFAQLLKCLCTVPYIFTFYACFVYFFVILVLYSLLYRSYSCFTWFKPFSRFGIAE